MENKAQTLYPSKSSGRPSKIAIIGAGAVGTAVAYACAMRGDARSIVLQDINKPKVEAEALDMAHGIQFTPAGSIEGSDDVEIVRGSDLIIVTAGAKQQPGQSRLELAGSTVNLMKKIVPNLQNVAPDARFMFVTNPVDVVTYVALKLTGLPRNQVFGSGTVLDTSRLRYLVSRETGVATQNIHAYVAGEHGDSEVALWSSAEIGNVPLSQWGPTLSGAVFDSALRNSIAQEVVQSAYKIIEGKGATNYAIGLSAANIAGAVLRDEQRVLTISTLLEDWEGISDVVMAAPTIVGRDGAGRRPRGVGTIAMSGESEGSDDGDDLAEDGGLVAGDGGVVLVVGQQPHVSIRDRQLFHGGLAVDHGCHELAVAGVVLGADDDVVAVEDAGIDHGSAGDLEHEEVAVTRHGGGQAENLFDVLLGGDGRTRGNAADERDGAALLLHVGHRNFDGHDG